MNVLFVSPNFGEDADTSFAPLMATELHDRNHKIAGVQYRDESALDDFPVDTRPVNTIDTPHWAGQWLLYRRLREPIHQWITEYDPDVVVADRMALTTTVSVAERRGVPAVGVVPGLGFTRFNPWDRSRDKNPSIRRLPWSSRFQYPFIRSLFAQQRQALQKASRVVVISDFLRDVLKTTFDVKTNIVRTPVRLKNVRASEHNPRYLTMVNPRTELKGVEILFDLVDNLDEEFLIAGEFADDKYAERAKRAENVTYLGWVSDMREVYRQTRLVIVPSLVEEGGGPRVVLEGFANSIPAVGTNRGAIPEHVANAGAVVDNPYDIEQWKECIKRVLSDYNIYARRATERAEQFDADPLIRCFEQILHSVYE
jgi:glycosyltransferase involved in cell wall biosynthesis